MADIISTAWKEPASPLVDLAKSDDDCLPKTSALAVKVCSPGTPVPCAPAATIPGAPATNGFCFRQSLKSLARKMPKEIWEIGRATWSCPVDLIRWCKARWHRCSLGRAFDAALVALGEKMYAVGIDDGQLGTQIVALEEKVHLAETPKALIRRLSAERRKLVKRLAESSLEDDGPLPGADAEYAKARKLLTSLGQHKATMITMRAPASQERLGQWRATIGYGIFGCLCLVFFTLIAGWPW